MTDNEPTVKKGICFADTLNIATKSINNDYHAVQDFDGAEKLMLFGVEGWDTAKDTKAFTAAFENNRFENIEIFGCDLKAKGTQALADGLKKGGASRIKSLELDNSPIDATTATVLFEAVNERDNIQFINLQGSVKSEGALKAVAKLLETNTGIARMDMKINEIKPTSGRCLGDMLMKNKALMDLDLFYNDLGPEGAGYIADALLADQCQLRVLNLCCNKIGDNGAVKLGDALAVNRTLEELHLALNDIKDDGAMRIADALNPINKPAAQQNPIFKVLDISANVIGVGGAKSIASLISYNDTMKSIDFTGIEPTPDGWEFFEAAFNQLNYVTTESKLKIKFSIVDIDDECLDMIEKAIGDNENIDYKRREPPQNNNNS